MPLTYVGAFGSQLVTEKRAVQVTTDNPAVIECKLEIQIGSDFIHVSQLPDIGTSDTFTFEIHTIIRNYLKSKLLPLTVGSVASDNTLVYGFGFYGTDAVGTTISGEVVGGGGSTVAYNISADDFVTFNPNLYTNNNTGNTNTLLLTDYSGTRKIIRNGYGCLSSLITTTLQSWVVVATDDSLNVISTTPYSANGKSIGATRYGSSLVFQASGVATRYFVAIVENPVGSGFTQTLRSGFYSFEVVDPCNYLELFWVNQFGVMETWIFDTNYSDSTQIEKASFLKNRPVNPSALDRGQDVYKVESVRRFKVWSDYHDMDTIKFLNSIALSPQVAIRVGGVLVPVIVENNSVDNFNYHEPINRITFDIVLANKRINVV